MTMPAVSFDQLRAVLADFLDSQVLPALSEADTPMRWILGGSSALILSRLEDYAAGVIPALQSLGVMDQAKAVNVEAAETFVREAFKKTPKLSVNLFGMPIHFDSSDGEAFLALLKRYGDPK